MYTVSVSFVCLFFFCMDYRTQHKLDENDKLRIKSSFIYNTYCHFGVFVFNNACNVNRTMSNPLFLQEIIWARTRMGFLLITLNFGLKLKKNCIFRGKQLKKISQRIYSNM